MDALPPFRAHDPVAMAPHRPRTSSDTMAALLLSHEVSQYREMERAFADAGGIANSDDVASLLRERTDQPISMLARWIVNRDVLSFAWQSQILLPMFQFERKGMVPRAAVVEVLRELTPVLTDWEIGLWFARPNAWLDNASPAQAIDRDPRAVHDAARAERYLAQG